MPGLEPKHNEILIALIVVTLALVAVTIALDQIYTPLNGVIRAGALLGYLAVFLTSLASNYMRELTRYFGRTFIKLHHAASITALASLATHASAAAWRSGSLSTFLPRFDSLQTFLSLGGRLAIWLFALTALTALFRRKLRNAWRPLHWLNYVAFLLGTVHAQLIGTSFQYLVVRLVSGAMALALIGVFINKRVQRARRARR
jgi:hypothetical protein